MEKLLHERLREWGNEACPLNIAFSEYDTSGFSYDDEVKELFNCFADEIERYYIPRPRFEDGEPVQFGEEFDSRNDGKTYSVNFIGRGSNGVGRVASGKGGCGMTAEEPLKRPIPKVYDADEVEIKVGDIVYDIHNATDSHLPIAVERITDERRVLCRYEGSKLGHYLASEITHEKPVFDANNVRICKGDTVWSVATGEKFSVEGLPEGTRNNLRLVGDVDGIANISTSWYAPHEVTHKEPDNQQRIDDDARKLVESISDRYEIDDTIWASDGVNGVGATTLLDEIGELLSRQRALIERGA